MDAFTIGKLAEAADVSVETVRYYQRRRLMREPPRPYGAIRRYSQTDVDRLRFIRAAKQLGFSLKDIGELLLLEEAGSCREVRRLANEKLHAVKAQIKGLRRTEAVLSAFVAQCDATRGRRACPLIASLQQAASTATT